MNGVEMERKLLDNKQQKAAPKIPAAYRWTN
jgi:hypothetical protein